MTKDLCLLHKLDYYGIHRETLTWIKEFLCGRSQQVVLESQVISERSVFKSFPKYRLGAFSVPGLYYPRTPDYTLCSGVHVCWSEHSDSSFVYGFMILDYGFGTMTATTYKRAQDIRGLIVRWWLFTVSTHKELQRFFRPPDWPFHPRGMGSNVADAILPWEMLSNQGVHQ